jgi:SAM-dependent methyltransferase
MPEPRPAADAREFFSQYYWDFMKYRGEYGARRIPIVRWWHDEKELNEVERTILDAIRDCEVVLDVGAGDLRVKRKLEAHGVGARYLTLDFSRHHDYDFRDLDDVPADSCDAVLLLEVVEHLTLAEFWPFLGQVLEKLRPAGRLIVSTPNAGYVEGIWAGDITHVHAYPIVDLAAVLRCYGFDSELYRVAWLSPSAGPRERIRYFVRRVLTNLLQVDHARGVLLVARRIRGPER